MSGVVLYNPGTGSVEEVHVLPQAELDRNRRFGLRAIKESLRVTGAQANALYALVRYPTVKIGQGSFGIVMLDPDDPRNVVKLTLDWHDAVTSQYVREIQSREPEVMRYTVKVHGSRVITHIDGHAILPNIGLVRSERVVSIGMLKRVKNERLKQLAGFVEVEITEAFFSAKTLKGAQREIVRDMTESIHGQKAFAEVPPATQENIRLGLAEYSLSVADRAAALLERAKPGTATGEFFEILVHRLIDVSAAAAAFREHGVMVCDLHGGNWGFRPNPADPTSLAVATTVLLDFGVSASKPQGAWGEEAVELRTRRVLR